MTAEVATEAGIDLARSFDESLAKILDLDAQLEAAGADQPLSGAPVADILGLGWHGVALDEEVGGLGLSQADRVRLAAVAGRRLLPAALRDEAFALAPLLARLAPNEPRCSAWLERLLAGELRGGGATTARSPDAAGAPASTPGQFQALGFLAPQTELLAVLGDGWAVLLPTGEKPVEIESLRGLDAGQGLARVRFQGETPPSLALTGASARALRRDYELALVSEALGAAERPLELSVEYAVQRHQFGRPIASFQALSHLLAEMRLAIETSRAGISQMVALAADTSVSEQRLERMAATLAHTVPAAARDAVEGAIQVHGGIGFSWELGLHLNYRRVLAIQYLLGGEAASAALVGASYLNARRNA